MRRVANAAALETRSRGIRQVLSPVVNIADDVRWGRVEETYGEDPFLVSEMGRVFVDAFEQAGVIATPKHFVANVGEGGRDSYPVFHNDRMLRERYYPPFEAAVRAGRARSVMMAYNSVNGLPATQNRHLMNEVLKRDWGFGGFILQLEFFESTGGARIRLMWDAGAVMTETAARSVIALAVRTAEQSDAAVVVVGIEEGEFHDRAFLHLPGRQEELIEAVAAAGKPVVVVLVGGSAITMSRWIDKVDAVIDVWYPGEQGGHAVAEVLFGDYNPAGRLPMTFPMTEGQLPLSYNHKPTGRGDDYLDSTGMALFPFGFGLSYTTFEYSNLRIGPSVIAPNGRVRITCTVKNTGRRAGDEVVQLYLRDVLGSMARPLMALAAFARVNLTPGQSREIVFDLGPEHLRMLDEEMRWIVEPGEFRVMIGASSKDIRLRGHFTVR